MAIAARRLGLDPPNCADGTSSGPRDFPYRTPTGGLYDSGDYEACLDDALELAGYAERRAGAGGRPRRGPARRRRPRLRGRAVDLEHGLHHARPDCRGARRGAAEVGQRRGRDRDRLAARRHHGAHRDDTAGPGARDRLRAGRRRRAGRRAGGRRRPDRRSTPRRRVDASPRATTPRASPGSAPARCTSRRGSSRPSCARSRPTSSAARARRSSSATAARGGGTERVSLRRLAGTAHWNPDGLPAGLEPGLQRDRVLPAPNLAAPDEDDRVASSAAHGFIADVAVVEVDRETGAVAVLDYVTVHDAGRLLNPLLADGQVRGGFAHGARRRAARAAPLRRGRQPADRHVHGLPLPDGAGDAAAPDRPPRDAVAVHAARRQGPRRGQHDERAGRDRERRRRRARAGRRRAAA